MKRDFEMMALGAGVLQDLASRREAHWRTRVSGFISLVRPVFLVLTPVNAAGAAVLARGEYPPLAKCLVGFIAVAFASCAVNVFNDFIDRQRDKIIWPERAIPSGRVKPGEALALALAAAFISMAIAWLVFDHAAFAILLVALALGGLYSAYLRNRVGYLSLPPIVGLIYVGGWAAFSPETLLTSALPWYLYLLGTVWQAAHIMTYYPLHLTPGEKAPPALFFRPSPKAAAIIGLLLTGLTVVLAVLLPLYEPSLGPFYLAIVLATGAFALITSFILFKDVRDRKACLRAFTVLTMFRLAISAAILVDFLWF